MQRKKIAILGSTGSIGRQTLDVVRQHPDRFQVEVITAGSNAALLAEQANEFSVPHAVICDVTKYDTVRDALIGNTTEVHAGIDAACDLVTGKRVDIVVASMGRSRWGPDTSNFSASVTRTRRRESRRARNTESASRPASCRRRIRLSSRRGSSPATTFLRFSV